MAQSTAALAFFLISSFVYVSTTWSKPSGDEPLQRSKRNILQMCELIHTHTNRGCLDYNNYGCFCGLGNAASRHVDGVDGCCRAHDRCYGDVSCFWMYPQFVTYNFHCDEGGCECTDSPVYASCAHTTCLCDLEFAQCLQRSDYNYGFSDYDRYECDGPIRERKRRSRQRAKADWRKLAASKSRANNRL